MIESEASEKPVTRRRGKELEKALLEAAWEELVRVGYTQMTMEDVAARAKTSRAVLYRRWKDKSELVLAAVRHYREMRPVSIPDTGSVREDLMIFLDAISQGRRELAAIASAQLGALMADHSMTFDDFRDAIVPGGGGYGLDTIIDRAVERGEIDARKLTPTVRQLPQVLWRYRVFFSGKPLPQDEIKAIVDEVFLPLVTPDKKS